MKPTPMKKYVLILIALCSWLQMRAQEINAAVEDSLTQQITQYYSKLPKEKIYLQTDKSCYVAGDTLWFRAHLVDAVSNVPSTNPSFPKDRSNFVYVELRENRNDSLLERVMIKRDSAGVFANALFLPGRIHTGKYTLVAYTRWMKNFGTEHFAYKQIQLIGEDFAEHAQRNASKSAEDSVSLTLSLMPEGGRLIRGATQQLAYKVIDSNGLGRDVSVRLVRTSDGEILQEGKSSHLGMGSLFLTPSDEPLRLEAYSEDGLSCAAPLPEACEQGVALMVNQRKENLFITPTVVQLDPSHLYLCAYGRNNILVEPLQGDKPIVIQTSKLAPGVMNIAIIDDTTKTVWAERLVFIYPQETDLRMETHIHTP